MPLTKFVRNVDDLSDDGGYKFRFRCDECSDGFESQYVAASANLLKTALEVFTIFRPFGFGRGAGRRIAESVDLGLRGKERDAAYERAVHEAQAQFRKCPACGSWVCPAFCWNGDAGMCERCAPDEREAAIKRRALRRAERELEQLDACADPGPASCPACGVQTRGAPFCHGCGLSLHSPRCVHCNEALAPEARYCGRCGRAQP
jgi:uncharacterized protein (UPF0212 family)